MQISLLSADPSVRFTKDKCFLQRSPLRLSTVFSYSTVWALGKRTALYPWATRDVSTADFSALYFAVCWCELPPWDAWMVNKTFMNHTANLQQTPPVLRGFVTVAKQIIFVIYVKITKPSSSPLRRGKDRLPQGGCE